MRNKIISGIFALVVLVIAGFGMNKSMKSYGKLGDTALKNVIALAGGENPETPSPGENDGNLWKGYMNEEEICRVSETKRCDFVIWIPGIGYCELGFDYKINYEGTRNPCTYTGNMNNQCDYYTCRRNL